jgi:hypothetical protein
MKNEKLLEIINKWLIRFGQNSVSLKHKVSTNLLYNKISMKLSILSEMLQRPLRIRSVDRKILEKEAKMQRT